MHTNFHSINYYHKIIIQYVYLCFVSNDLVKIGESILDYIEFLIKFKLKTSKKNRYILNINNKDKRKNYSRRKFMNYYFHEEYQNKRKQMMRNRATI